MNILSNIKKVQDRLLEIGIAIKNILEKHNIPYFITYGTLLGAVRHGGFIPWDDDFDFYLFEDSYDRAIDALKEELPKSMIVEDSDSEPNFFHGWARVKCLNTVAENAMFPQDSVYYHRGINVDLYKAYKVEQSDEPALLYREYVNYLDRRKRHQLISNEEYVSRMEAAKQNYKNMSARADMSGNESVYVFPSPYDDRIFPKELFPLRKYQFEGYEFYGPNDAAPFLTRCYGHYMELPPEEKRSSHYSSVVFVK